MNWLDFDFKKAMRWILALTLPLVAIKIQERPPYDTWFDRPVSFIVTSTQESVFNLLDATKSLWTLYVNLIHTQKENLILKAENDVLRTHQSQLQELREENNKLRSFISLKERSPMVLLAAEAISSSTDLRHHSLWINKGEADGLKIGQAVLSEATIVGSVIRLLAHKAQVLLVTDRFSVVDGLVARTRARGIIEGSGGDNAVFKSFEKLTDLMIGDEVISTGVDQAFPKGIRVAKVTDIQVDRETGLPKAILEAQYDANKLDKLFIVISGSDIDQGFWSEGEKL